MSDRDELAKKVEVLRTALERARAALAAEQARAASHREQLEAANARLLELNPDDFKALARAQAELTGLQVGLRVVQEARLPKAEQLAAKVERALAAAERELDTATKVVRLQALKADALRLEEDLLARIRTFKAEIEPVVAAHHEAWVGGSRLARELGEEWDAGALGARWAERVARWQEPWPSGDDLPHVFFESLGHAIEPPPPPPSETPHERMVREAGARAAERAVRWKTSEPSPPAPSVGASGLDERELLRLADRPDEGGRKTYQGPRTVNPQLGEE